MERYMVDCDIHLLHVGTWVCCCKSFSIAKSETSLLCGMFIVSVDIRLGMQRKYIKESLIKGEYKNVPRDMKAFTLLLRSIVKSEILTALFMKIQVF
jgi:hypothetical protein